MNEYKTTFNYLLSHRVMPQSIFANIDLFYESIIVNPTNLQIYLMNVYQTATAWAKRFPDTEPVFTIEKFEMGIIGNTIETSVITIKIPNCKELNDCALIAIPCMKEHARYFTCELSDNPVTGEKFFIAGEWKIKDGGMHHTNYGPIDDSANCETFISKVIKLTYGVDYEPTLKNNDEQVEKSNDDSKDMYSKYISLVKYLRILTADGKTIKESVNEEDYLNLAAVLAKEEDYDLLTQYVKEGLPLDNWVGREFLEWRPTPIFYVTTSKVWRDMKEPEKMIAFLAKHGADPNTASAEGDTPLYNQCLSKGNPKIMKALLEAGADPNFACCASNGMEAAPLVTVLCPQDYNEETYEFTPITQSQVERAKMLVEAGADVNNVTKEGETPLGLAITYGAGENRQELIKFFCAKGADIDSALHGMEECFGKGFSEYGYALYELYSGFPGMQTIPEISKLMNSEKTKFFIEESANNGYPPALSVLGVTEPPSPSGKYLHDRAVKLWNNEKKAEALIQFKEAFKRCAAYPETALLPMPVSNYLKEVCLNKGWLVYQRLSISGKLFPLLLIGGKKVVVTLEASSEAAEILSKAAEEIRANYRNLIKDGEPKDIEVIPAALIFAQDEIIEPRDKNIKVLNAGAICCNRIQGITDFEEFIEKMGQQEQMSQELNDMIHVAVIAVVDSGEEEDEQDEYDDGKYEGEA